MSIWSGVYTSVCAADDLLSVLPLRLEWLVVGLLLTLGSFWIGRWSLQRSDPQICDRTQPDPLARSSNWESHVRQQIAALQQSKEHYRQLADDMPALICRFLPDSTLTYVNSTYCEYFNQRPEDLIGHQFLDFLPEEERPATQAQYMSLSPDAPFAVYEHPTVQADGSRGWQHWVNRAFFDEQGNLTHLQSIGLDITEQKRREAEQDQIAEALRQERNLLSRIMAMSPAGIVVLNPTGQITFANDRATQILGLTKDEAVGRTYNAPVWQIQSLDGSPLPESEFPFVRVMQTKQPVFNVQHGIQTSVGQLLLLSVNAAPSFDASGQIDGVVATLEDITDRKRAEIALQESEARFRQLAENVQEVFWLSDVDIHRILYISPAYEQIWGRSLESINTDPKSFLDAIHPHDRQRVVSNLSHPQAPFEIEYRIVQPSGEIRWIRDRGFPIFDESGNVTRRAGLAQDITERKQAEDKLRRLTERLELAIQSANIGIWEWDSATDYLVWDDRMCALYGIQSSELNNVWTAWEARLHPDDLSRARSVVQQALDNQQNYQMEFRIVLPDGSIRYIASYALMQPEPERNSIRLVGANLDISDRKQAELEIRQLNAALEQQNRDLERLVAERTAELTRRTAQLEASNKELESFSYSVSHDLRAPLRHIHGFVNALQQRLQGQEVLNDAKVAHYLQVIENSSQKMAQLIDGLLTLSRIGRKPIVYAPVPLRQLVDEVIEIVNGNLETVDAVNFVIGALPTVMGDATLLQQVLINLIGNAVKFSRQQAQPQIEIGQASDGAIFVKDNGVGFQMKYADKLFGAFQRLHAQTEFEGTGIGLAIVQRIIHRHGGIIWAESEPHQETVFYFTLDNIS
ncbi:MAG: PAS domain-containing sensor histidine kinase [Thainema sp.]